MNIKNVTEQRGIVRIIHPAYFQAVPYSLIGLTKCRTLELFIKSEQNILRYAEKYQNTNMYNHCNSEINNVKQDSYKMTQKHGHLMMHLTLSIFKNSITFPETLIYYPSTYKNDVYVETVLGIDVFRKYLEPYYKQIKAKSKRNSIGVLCRELNKISIPYNIEEENGSKYYDLVHVIQFEPIELVLVNKIPTYQKVRLIVHKKLFNEYQSIVDPKVKEKPHFRKIPNNLFESISECVSKEYERTKATSESSKDRQALLKDMYILLFNGCTIKPSLKDCIKFNDAKEKYINISYDEMLEILPPHLTRIRTRNNKIRVVNSIALQNYMNNLQPLLKRIGTNEEFLMLNNIRIQDKTKTSLVFN